MGIQHGLRFRFEKEGNPAGVRSGAHRAERGCRTLGEAIIGRCSPPAPTDPNPSATPWCPAPADPDRAMPGANGPTASHPQPGAVPGPITRHPVIIRTWSHRLDLVLHRRGRRLRRHDGGRRAGLSRRRLRGRHRRRRGILPIRCGWRHPDRSRRRTSGRLGVVGRLRLISWLHPVNGHFHNTAFHAACGQGDDAHHGCCCRRQFAFHGILTLLTI